MNLEARIRLIRALAVARGDLNLVRECDAFMPPAVVEVALPDTDTLETAVPVKRGPGRPRKV